MKDKGFSMLEILLVLFILSLVVAMVAFSFSKFNSSKALNQSASLVVAILDEARSLTLSSVDASGYGVNFQESQVVLFKGVTYSPSDPSNVVTDINALVNLRNIVLSGGGTSVVFKRLTGNTDEAGTVEVFLKATPEIFRTVSISNTGVAASN
ncbi:MAG: prepilin-type N-terminal cleavage/methylation domain-containing protein [bacterium]|nr:prepilin-type N-terminal cleavage/methylation domain-containing protein [bacterium]